MTKKELKGILLERLIQHFGNSPSLSPRLRALAPNNQEIDGPHWLDMQVSKGDQQDASKKFSSMFVKYFI